MAEDTGRKRASSRQLTDRDDVDESVETVDQGVFEQADATTMAARKVVKVRRGGAGAASNVELPKPAINWGFTAATTAAVPTTTNTTEQTTPQAASVSPVKETTPVKSTTPEKPASPVKELSTPVKEATPTKEQNGEKAATPNKEEAKPTSSTPTETKPPAPFSFINPPAASSTFPAFPSFSFTPQPNLFGSSSGASIFGQNIAPPKPKDGSDDEGGEDPTEPEPEPTGAPTVLPPVPVVTGEEDETTLHSVRAKLFAMEGQAWKERGVGALKLNRNKAGKLRLIMRDQGGKHLRLNVAVFAEMKFERAADNAIRFVALVDKAHTVFLLKVARKDEATELLSALENHKSKGPGTPEKTNGNTTTTTTTTPTTTTSSNSNGVEKVAS